MKKVIYRILLGVTALLALSSTAVFLVLGRERHEKIPCRGISVTIKDSTENHFVTGKDVEDYVRKGYGKVEGVPVSELKLDVIEKAVTLKSAVLRCEAYLSPDGLLNLEVTQRTPVARFQTASNGWYADEDGFIFPLQRSYTSMVPIIDGDFPVNPPRGFKGMLEDGAGKDWMMRVVAMVGYMRQTGWDRRITQIHVDRNGEITLIPATGKEKFLFGQPDSFVEKFGKMDKYYRMILPMDKGYVKVDLRFDSQIVCSEMKTKA
ncbi:MAG: cell division protein FtsQ/DivIB [Candidatus Cryptobacteroides sp.]